MSFTKYLPAIFLLLYSYGYAQPTKEYTELMGNTGKSFAGSTDPTSGKYSYSIPIADFRDKEFGFSLSLNYTSSSIKFREVPDATGLGWSLNVPILRREIRGLPDELGRNRRRLLHKVKGKDIFYICQKQMQPRFMML